MAAQYDVNVVCQQTPKITHATRAPVGYAAPARGLDRHSAGPTPTPASTGSSARAASRARSSRGALRGTISSSWHACEKCRPRSKASCTSMRCSRRPRLHLQAGRWVVHCTCSLRHQGLPALDAQYSAMSFRFYSFCRITPLGIVASDQTAVPDPIPDPDGTTYCSKDAGQSDRH